MQRHNTISILQGMPVIYSRKKISTNSPRRKKTEKSYQIKHKDLYDISTNTGWGNRGRTTNTTNINGTHHKVIYQYALQKNINHCPLNLQYEEHHYLGVIEIGYTSAAGGKCCMQIKAGDELSCPGIEMPAALLTLFAYEVINLVTNTTVRTRSDLFWSKFCPLWVSQY